MTTKNAPVRDKQPSWHQRLVRPLKYLACVYWGIGVLGETQSYMTAIGLIALGCVLIAEGDLNDERQKVNDVLRERLDIAHRRIDALCARMESSAPNVAVSQPQDNAANKDGSRKIRDS